MDTPLEFLMLDSGGGAPPDPLAYALRSTLASVSTKHFQSDARKFKLSCTKAADDEAEMQEVAAAAAKEISLAV